MSAAVPYPLLFPLDLIRLACHRGSAVLILAGLCTLGAGAQADTYRWIDPHSGAPVLSDRPPPATVRHYRRLKDPVGTGTDQTAPQDGVDLTGQPYENRLAAAKYPVLLYVSPNCGEGCTQAQDLLRERGIPHREINVTPTDQAAQEALSKESGNRQVPFLKVGPRSQLGFRRDAWNRLLDAAGYAKKAP